MKKCGRCRRLLPPSAFPPPFRHAGEAYREQNTCRDCKKAYNLRYRAIARRAAMTPELTESLALCATG